MIQYRNEIKNTPVESQQLEFYKVGDKINFRIKSKTEITKTLESSNLKDQILTACNDLKSIFIHKVKSVVEDNNDNIEVLNKNIESIFNVSISGKRTQQNHFIFIFVKKLTFIALLI